MSPGPWGRGAPEQRAIKLTQQNKKQQNEVCAASLEPEIEALMCISGSVPTIADWIHISQ